MPKSAYIKISITLFSVLLSAKILASQDTINLPQYKVGEKVLTQYRGNWYPATLNGIKNGRFLVSFQVKSRQKNNTVNKFKIAKICLNNPRFNNLKKLAPGKPFIIPFQQDDAVLVIKNGKWVKGFVYNQVKKRFTITTHNYNRYAKKYSRAQLALDCNPDKSKRSLRLRSVRNKKITDKDLIIPKAFDNFKYNESEFPGH